MRKKLIWALGVLLVLSGAAFGALCYLAGSPRDAYGMVRYALPHMKLGNLKAGDQAPDFEAVALDGETRVRLYDRIGQRPLVLVFGSYT
jgi:hypothetical protein